MLIAAVEVAFVALFVGSLVAFVRRRDRLQLDVLLVFGSIAYLYLLQGIQALGLRLPVLLATSGAISLLAHAPFSLRLASDLAPVPRRWLLAAWAVFAILSVSLLIPPIARLAVLPAVAYFVVVDAGAALAMASGARRRGGSAQVRLWSAAAGTGFMALALLVLGARGVSTAIAPVTQVLVEVLALGSALAYLNAFLPPGPLRSLWQSRSGLRATERLLATTTGARPGDVWQTLAELGTELSGAEGAVLFAGAGGGGEAARLAHAGDVADEPVTLDPDTWSTLVVMPAAVPDVSATGLPAALRQVTEGRQVTSASIVSVAAGESGHVILVLLHRYRSLFGDDERALLHLLGTQAAILAERESALAQSAALATRLSNTVEALQNANEAKSDFLASMSHELRTPLNAILGFSDLMRLEPADGERRAVPEEWIDHVNSAGRHLLELINDVLDLAKVEAGRIELRQETLDVGLAVGEVLTGLQPLADRKGLTITSIHGADQVVADRGRFRQILYNLVSNAIKYTPAGGWVRVESALNDTDEVEVSVSDSGVGIAPDDLDRVFQEFTQVGDPATHQEGTGLGLALTRRLVEAHGGRLDVRSELGSGSTFTIVLPPPEATGVQREDAAKPARAAASMPTPSNEVGPVLVIEDDRRAVDLIRGYLRDTDYGLVSAPTGIDGVAAARRHRPLAILLDILLPDIDGWEVLRRLKADAELRDIPVVVVTVVDQRELGLALGAADYLLKPVDGDALVAALDRSLPRTDGRPPSVLAIDDDPATLTLLRSVLEPSGARVHTADSGRSGLQMAREADPDLVICDLLMPDIDGFEVIAQLKASPATSRTPILVLTAHSLSEADKARLNGQVVGVCEKGSGAGAALRSWLESVMRGDLSRVGLTHPSWRAPASS
jgi:signal transduction histidine kinase/CheY-like chemotaxis protein